MTTYTHDGVPVEDVMDLVVSPKPTTRADYMEWFATGRVWYCERWEDGCYDPYDTVRVLYMEEVDREDLLLLHPTEWDVQWDDLHRHWADGWEGHPHAETVLPGIGIFGPGYAPDYTKGN